MINQRINLRLLVAGLCLGACATPPKPRELEMYEGLRKNAGVADAAKKSPDLVANADRLASKAGEEWQSNDLEESRRDALMASIKLKTALAISEQDQMKARIQLLSNQQADAEEELATVTKDLASAKEALDLRQKLGAAQKSAAADRERLSQEMSSEQQKAQAEKQKLSLQLATEQKLAAAQLALRTADTVEANRYAAAPYSAAADMLKKAEAEIKAGDLNGAQVSAEVARQHAERAAELAKPAYEQAEQTTQNRARDEALQRDATAIPGVAVRIERIGDSQRLVISVQDLFNKKETSLGAGHEPLLDSLAVLINKYPTYPIHVLGRTESRGKPGELLAMSQARAQSVSTALAARGVDPRRMTVSADPAPSGDSKAMAAARSRSNRVEIVFLYH
ncbi:MAG TPA: OmpA family protein [Polyangia bacterium]|jgi:outer membrane protein OmpA-like peptidoglycan-associated protein|nr:OmpA family protein [Polyangia bacterium]